VPIVVAGFVYRRSSRSFIEYLLAAATPVVATYALAYRFVDHKRFPTLLTWVTNVSSESKTTHSLGQLFGTNIVSYLKLFAGGRWSLVQQYLSAPVYVSLLCCVCLIAYAIWIWHQPQSKTHPALDKRLAAVLIAWLAPYVLFLSWFEPGNAFYKLFIWPAIVLLLSFLVRAREKAAVALTLGLAGWNLGAFIYPHSRSTADPVLALAEKIDRELPKSATVYYREFVPDDWYLKYFAPGRIWKPLPPKLGVRLGLTCFETTALDVVHVPENSKIRWAIVNNKHNVQLECVRPEGTD